jgi:2,4-dienoyl-CoA reductase (NADPH2)
MLRYWRRRIETTGVHLHLNTPAHGRPWPRFDEVIVATGVTPRDPKIPGQDIPRC